jgi:quercetin dioxygenase-like cupin family protein
MRVLRSRKKWSVAIAGVVVIGTFVAVALGSLGTGFTPTTLVTGTLNNAVKVNHDRVKFQTKDPTDVRVQQIVFAAGGKSGWHHHPGVVIATVASGAVTFTESDCSSTTYGPGLPAGSVFVEKSDTPGQASSAAGATVYVTFIVPHANPPVFRIEDTPPPPCVPSTGHGDGGDNESNGGSDGNGGGGH